MVFDFKEDKYTTVLFLGPLFEVFGGIYLNVTEKGSVNGKVVMSFLHLNKEMRELVSEALGAWWQGKFRGSGWEITGSRAARFLVDIATCARAKQEQIEVFLTAMPARIPGIDRSTLKLDRDRAMHRLRELRDEERKWNDV